MSRTCPDRQMLSVYFDGELPSPWKEKMESHLSACPACAGRLEAYGGISPGPPEDDGEAVREAGERVWHRLGDSLRHGMPSERRRRGAAIWRRKLSVPLPAAAAAALLVVGLAFTLTLRDPGDEGVSGTVLASETELYMPAPDMESIIQYLIGRSPDDMLILRLPENRSFVNNGDPAVVRAADYSRMLAGLNPQGRRRH